MKQILQNLKTGETKIEEIPCPQAGRGQLLIRSTCSLISAGTERMLVDFGKANWLDKARQQPDKVRIVLNKIKTDGIGPTVQAVMNKLDQPLALGYCNVGVIDSVGKGVHNFQPRQRVISNGKHAEMVVVPENLCALIPDFVSDEEAAFTVIGAIGLQGIRLIQPTLGETVVVTGLGLIGLLTVQLLLANGCKVIGIDFDSEKLALAKQFGAETINLSTGADPVSVAMNYTQGHGVDAVIITASTKSNEPMHQAAQMCRKRGRVVLVGVTGLELSRADFYEKEISFQVSCSYGPGRYEANYEDKGLDYPIGFVRWTEQRNFEAVLAMLASEKLNVKPLISHKFSILEAESAYKKVSEDKSVLGILLQYSDQPDANTAKKAQTVSYYAPKVQASEPVVSFLGAGNYASAVLMPAFRKAGAQLNVVSSGAGVSGVHAAKKFGFASATTDSDGVLNDAVTNCVVIATRHNSHARWVLEALKYKKHIFVEKPLALTLEEVEQIQEKYKKTCSEGFHPILMVGFNRRFSPLVQKIYQLTQPLELPMVMVATINAGFIPPEHWTQDLEIGGGRIVGEACHFIDLLRYLADAEIANFHVSVASANKKRVSDCASITFEFSNGSIGTVHYLANGHKELAKERLEVFVGGRVLQLDNFRKLTGFGWPGFSSMKLWSQDKGQEACVKAFTDAVKQGLTNPIPLGELWEVSKCSIEIAEAANG